MRLERAQSQQAETADRESGGSIQCQLACLPGKSWQSGSKWPMLVFSQRLHEQNLAGKAYVRQRSAAFCNSIRFHASDSIPDLCSSLAVQELAAKQTSGKSNRCLKIERMDLAFAIGPQEN